MNRGCLFSALSFASSPFGERWSGIRSQAQARFPALKIKQTEDLHATLVYLGPAWRPEDLDLIRPLAVLHPPPGDVRGAGVTRMGHHGRAAVLELAGADPEWVAAILRGKARLAALGLRKEESADPVFRLHITLGEQRRGARSAEEGGQMEAFVPWISERLAGDPPVFALGPDTPARLLLSGAPRPAGGPDYVEVTAFLATRTATGSPERDWAQALPGTSHPWEMQGFGSDERPRGPMG
jgi:2'-5' RNA ligase